MTLKNAKLIIIDGPSIGKQFLLHDLPITIGRTDEADIVIPDNSISRKHIKLSLLNNVVTVNDLGSKNGIEVNSKIVQKQKSIFDGDTLTVGKVKLKCVMPNNLRPASVLNHEPVVEVVKTQTNPNYNSNIALAVVLFIGVILSITALILVYDDSEPPAIIKTLSVNQELLVATDFNLKNVDIKIQNQRVVRVHPSNTLVNVMWLKGAGVGDSVIQLYNRDGDLLQSYKAVVRGIYHDIENELGLMEMDIEERVNLAKNFALEAKSLERDSILDAIYTYDKAIAAVKNLPSQEEYYLQLQQQRDNAKNKFEAIFKSIGQEYVMARSNDDIQAQFRALKKIKQLVPDQTHPYYQKAKYYYERLQKRLK